MHTQFSWMATEELIRHQQCSEDELVQELINRVELAEKKFTEESNKEEKNKNKKIVSFIEEVAGDEFFDELIFLLSKADQQSKPDMKLTIKEVLGLVSNQKQMVHNTIDCVLHNDY